MVKLTTEIPAIAFPAELDTLTFKGDAAETFGLRLLMGAKEILATTLLTDQDGRFTLQGLATLLTDHADAYGRPASLDIYVNGDFEDSCDLLPCRVDVGEAAADFLDQHFLSLADGTLALPADAPSQLLTWYDVDAPAATVTAEWYDPASHRTLEDVSYYPPGGSDGICQADIPPSALGRPAAASAEAVLLSYEVSVGHRRQRFLVIPRATASLSLQFTNAFAQEEVFHFLGRLETELKTERDTASFSGHLRNYRTEAYEEIKVHTGPLSPSALPQLCDLAASPSLTRLPDRETFIITDDEVKTTSEAHTLIEATITLRRDRTLPRVRLTPHVRTFDKTFDATFD